VTEIYFDIKTNMKNSLNNFSSQELLIKTLYDNLDEKYFLELEKFIKNNVDSIVKDSRFLLTFSELYSAFAISKAEDSELILAEAQEIQRI
jgi:hypothetical protein